MAGGGGGGDGEPEFQIAPMIDVLLVLLIFFMSITTAQVLKVDKRIVLPASANAKKKDPEAAKHELPLNLRWDKASSTAILNVNDRDYPEKMEVVDIMKAKLASDPKLQIIVRGDKDLPAVEIQRIMDLIGQAGIADISFSASNK